MKENIEFIEINKNKIYLENILFIVLNVYNKTEIDIYFNSLKTSDNSNLLRVGFKNISKEIYNKLLKNTKFDIFESLNSTYLVNKKYILYADESNNTPTYVYLSLKNGQTKQLNIY